MKRFFQFLLLAIAVAHICCNGKKSNAEGRGNAGSDPLPSWNDGRSKKSILDFVQRVTSIGSPYFVQSEDRIAVFDNDGTLWVEQPMYFQFFFTIDRVKQMAAQHPEWQRKEPFKSIIAGDTRKALTAGEKGIVELMMSTHVGMSTEAFDSIVNDWTVSARHPRYQKPFTECVYQPMLELMNYLRYNGFKTFIVSGGGIEFMRPWTQRVYGIPPEQVIGSSVKTKFEERNGSPVLLRLPEINFIDDKEGKPVGIQEHIGRRPIAAFGNSDGDFQMLEWTTTGPGLRLGLIVHHDDSVREWAYDRHSLVGQLDRGLNEASGRNWIVVSMKKDWSRIFPGE